MGESSIQKAVKAAYEFYRLKVLHEQEQREFDRQKDMFYDAMGEYFGNNMTTAKFGSEDDKNGMLIVKKVETASIEWDAEKLEKRVDKSIAKKVIKKEYRVSDMQGLISYLKSCGVDPKIFKRHIIVDKTVDEKAVDRLGDTGQLTVKQISGCYTVKSKKPYFTITVKKNE